MPAHTTRRVRLLATLAATLAALFAPTGLQGAPVAITGVTVIDVDEGRRLPARTVVVEGGRIVAAGPAAEVKVPAGATRLDGAGSYVIPGLWDMHVHTLWPDMPGANFPLFIANGVTGVRDLHATLSFEELAALRRAVEAGERLGPHLVFAGPLVDGSHPYWTGSLSVGTPAEAAAAVARLAEGAVDFVKPYDSLTRESYLALAASARERGLPLAGHVPIALSVADVAGAGQKTIEHLDALAAEASTRHAELTARAHALVAKGSDAPPDAFVSLARAAATSIDPERVRGIAATLTKHGTWVTPTLAVVAAERFDAASARAEATLRYVPSSRRTRWLQGLAEETTGEERASQARALRGLQDLVRGLATAGAGLLAGTDVGNPFVVAGFSLHDELELLVEAGLTPAAALATATTNPARCLGRRDVGAVAVGHRADLVLLDADPLADIRHTRRIRAVIVGGRVLDRSDLDRLLADAEARAAAPASPRPSPSP